MARIHEGDGPLKELLDGMKAALFDFDGILVDSEPIHCLTYSEVFKRRGHVIDEEEYWIYWTSKGEGIAGEIRRHGLTGFDPGEIKREKDALYFEACASGKIGFFDGAIETMKRFEDLGFKVAIASNSTVEWIEAIFASNKIGYRPPFIVGKTPELKPKPSPDIFVRAAEVVVEEPGRCVVFEDAEKGVTAAKEIGMGCVVIRNHLNRHIRFDLADVVVDSMKGLLKLIGDPERS